MKKIVLFAVMIIAAVSFAQESKKITWDGGVELAMPMGDFADAAGMGIGISAKVYYPVKPEIDITGRLGYIYISGEDDDWSFSEIPFMFGGRYKFPNKFYGLFEMGFTNFTVNWDGGDDDETELTFAFGGGYMHEKFDFSAFINSVQTEGDSANHFGIRVGYKFM
ncbi:MAG: outer membrane beta-barrel protein [Candidatus Delongbacteria bacterium]